ncbi:hypothetical protein CAPTEDRAFT_164006 [Capitella teleta]|uniref:Leucine-rich repeat-containing protein 51 n=1 Tax=Capitella teleta TaxID=283909 RepID=R7V2N7_CAPTE|nr:hypothetical protein CAPTEDRAFT_164006 [Capitella teleta]|eukprot:ELU12804.1 hypothetical protein CAPTEDRAFT_164006 [Capitella teleta]
METPLDFSFLSIAELTELETEEPRALLGKNVPRDEEGKFNCKCLKLNNNQIADLKGLLPTLTKIILDPSVLSWIDISFNELTRIDPVFCDFPNLQILYLHGNQITDIKEVDKLAGVKNLKKLCLHGNPIETTKSYRWYVMSELHQLQSLDMSGITKADRVTASTWKSTNPTKKKKKRMDE